MYPRISHQLLPEYAHPAWNWGSGICSMSFFRTLHPDHGCDFLLVLRSWKKCPRWRRQWRRSCWLCIFRPWPLSHVCKQGNCQFIRQWMCSNLGTGSGKRRVLQPTLLLSCQYFVSQLQPVLWRLKYAFFSSSCCTPDYEAMATTTRVTRLWTEHLVLRVITKPFRQVWQCVLRPCCLGLRERLGDFDGDGRMDLVRTSPTEFYGFYSRGDSSCFSHDELRTADKIPKCFDVKWAVPWCSKSIAIASVVRYLYSWLHR